VPPLKLLSFTAQVVEHLRAELARGQWSETMPGVDRLAVELGVNHKIVEAALRQLEREGLLRGQGPRRRRLIVPPDEKAPRPLRIGLLPYERHETQQEYIARLPDALMNAGHAFVHTVGSLVELKMDVARVSRFVKRNTADAWIVISGSREVLEWFSGQPKSAFALFGRRQGLPIASIGPDFRAADVAAVRHLVNLGHRRIVLLARRERRLPEPGPPERAFLDELKALGVGVSDYNLPDWVETKEGLRRLLESLFRVTPPTALIIDDFNLFIATHQFLSERGLRVPQHISVISSEPQPGYSWCMTEIAHHQWDSRRVIPRIIRWAEAVSRGQRDVKQTLVPAEFVPGGTIGPAPKGERQK
jgi:DNA-binding LacI/PurR family transcriptional regulator/DNA-binding transcriptional regulator YhcF (GntR family)